MLQVVENDESELDVEFAELFKELTEINEAENDSTAEEYTDFDIEISSFHLPIPSEMVDWKAASIQEVIFLASFFFIKLVDIYFCI